MKWFLSRSVEQNGFHRSPDCYSQQHEWYSSRSDAGEVQGGIPIAKFWVWHIDSANSHVSQYHTESSIWRGSHLKLPDPITWPHLTSSWLTSPRLTWPPHRVLSLSAKNPLISSHLTLCLTSPSDSCHDIWSKPYLISSITAPTKSMSLTKTSSVHRRT